MPVALKKQASGTGTFTDSVFQLLHRELEASLRELRSTDDASNATGSLSSAGEKRPPSSKGRGSKLSKSKVTADRAPLRTRLTLTLQPPASTHHPLPLTLHPHPRPGADRRAARGQGGGGRARRSLVARRHPCAGRGAAQPDRKRKHPVSAHLHCASALEKRQSDLQAV